MSEPAPDRDSAPVLMGGDALATLGLETGDEVSGHLVRPVAPADAEPALRTVADALTVRSWSDLRFLVDGALAGAGRATDHGGFGVVADGVVTVVDAGDHAATVDVDDLHRLLARMVDAAVETAAAAGDDVVDEAWWPGLLDGAADLRTGTAPGH